MWLQKAGGNVLTCEWSHDSVKKGQIKVKQTHVREEHQTLRYHKINIAYIKKGGIIVKQ